MKKASFNTSLGHLHVEFCSETRLLSQIFFADFCDPAFISSPVSLPELLARLCLPTPKSPFSQQVREVVRAVPPGETVTYGEVAAKVGNSKAARAVGQVMARNPFCLFIPCHRVVPANRGIGFYRWGVERKHALLELERSGMDAWKLLR